MPRKICKQCGTEFQGQKASTKFCSKPCAGQAKRTSYNKKCKECGGTFETHPSADCVFCSKNCAYKNAKRTCKLQKRIKKQCEFCGDIFEFTPGAERKRIKQFGVGPKFCSAKCMGKYKSSQFGHQPIDRQCLNCGKDFKADHPYVSTQCCSHQCASELRVKEVDKRVDEIKPQILEYWNNHTLHEVAAKFDIGLTVLRRHGIYSTQKLLACPDELTAEQLETIIGNLLGDGCLSYAKDGQNTHFSIGQKGDRAEYINGLFDIYSPFSCGISERQNRKPSRKDGKINHELENWNGEYTNSITMYTVCHPLFTSLRNKWYKEPAAKRSQKIIPADLRLTWRTAAIWLCDDGSNHGNDVIKGRNYSPRYLMLHTESFSEEDVQFLIACLQRDLDVKATLSRHDGKPTIRISSDDWYQFIERAKPHIPWNCFQYKCKNREKISKNTSGFIGVSFHHGSWRASKSFRINGKCVSYHIGSFETPELAAKTRQEWIENRLG